MILIILFTFLLFIFYFLASFNTLKSNHRILFISLFILSSIVLRYLINPDTNKDYYGYFYFNNFFEPKDFLSFFFTEPYLYFVYKFFSLFSSDATTIFLGMYWYNLILTNIFFIWLVTRNDISIWKKTLLFTFYYFLFAFVLLRNGPVYILFACFFYYSYRNKNFKAVLLTPFMHISSLAIMITIFHKKKKYLFLLSFMLVIVPLILFFIMPILTNMLAFEKSLYKINAYSEEMDVVSVFHKVYFLFVTVVVFITFWIYKKKALNPILLTAVGFYYIFFYLNPVVGFRFTPYVFFAILLFNFDGVYNKQIVKIVNVISVLLFPYFLLTLFDSHYL